MEKLPQDLLNALSAIFGIDPERYRLLLEGNYSKLLDDMQEAAMHSFRSARPDDHHTYVLRAALFLADQRRLNERNLSAALADDVFRRAVIHAADSHI